MSKGWTPEEQAIAEQIAATGNCPGHVAIIMDGNGRWAKQRFMPRVAGHRAGMNTVRMAVRTSGELHIDYLTLYAFSTENWTRPRAEVNALMDLLLKYLKIEADDLDRNNVRLRTVGRTNQLPQQVQDALSETEERLDRNDGLTLILALSYSGKAELLDAVKKMVADAASGSITPDSVNDKMFRNYMYLPEAPDPDLMIRTSGEMRISNFYLWQLAYAELAVTSTLWPDFSREQYLKLILDYCMRDRRYGGVPE